MTTWFASVQFARPDPLQRSRRRRNDARRPENAYSSGEELRQVKRRTNSVTQPDGFPGIRASNGMSPGDLAEGRVMHPRMERDPAGAAQQSFLQICESEWTFRAWYELALPRVYGYVHGRTGGDTELAQEITQQAFISAVEARRNFDERSDAVTWVCSIARNALVDHYRRLHRDRLRHLTLVVREIAMDDDARSWAIVDDREAVVGALGTLTPDQRLAVVMHYVDGLPIREISRLMRRSEASVASLLARGRDRLRLALEAPQ